MGLEDDKKRYQELADINPIYNKLFVFDFDGTLAATPLPDEGKEIWKQKTGNDYPSKGWWGNIESINTDIFDIKPIQSTLNDYRRATTEKNSLVIMLTSRMPDLKNGIKKIIDGFGLKFDDYLFKRKEQDKPERIDDILKYHPDIKHVEIWDDRQKEIDLFAKWKEEYQKREEKDEIPLEERTKIIIHHV